MTKRQSSAVTSACLSLLLLVACAGKPMPTEQQRQSFNTFVAEAAEAMELNTPVISIRSGPVLYDRPEIEVATHEIPGHFWSPPSYTIHISNKFLAEAGTLLLRHAAAHEMCHIKKWPGEEIRADRCAFEYLGEETFIAGYRLRARRSPKLYPSLVAASDERLREVVLEYLGME